MTEGRREKQMAFRLGKGEKSERGQKGEGRKGWEGRMRKSLGRREGGEGSLALSLDIVVVEEGATWGESIVENVVETAVSGSGPCSQGCEEGCFCFW